MTLEAGLNFYLIELVFVSRLFAAGTFSLALGVSKSSPVCIRRVLSGAESDLLFSMTYPAGVSAT